MFEKQQLRLEEFREKVRNKRELKQAERLERLQGDTGSSTINGRAITATRINGDFRP